MISNLAMLVVGMRTKVICFIQGYSKIITGTQLRMHMRGNQLTTLQAAAPSI